jgi:hypothetical protein
MNRKPHLPRRTFLKGVSATMALPLLEAMIPGGDFSLRTAVAAGTGTSASGLPVRMAFVFFPNGAIMPSWKPTGEGRGFELSETLAPLKSVKDDILVITGLAQDNGRAKGDGPGDHARSAASFLTGAHPFKTAGANINVGVSVDQAAAERIGERTKLPSIELGIEKGRNAGNCDSGYSCAYSNNISWKSATTPMAKEINPRHAFDRLFGAPRTPEQAKRDLYRKSILDVVQDDAKQLQSKLGKTDRRKLDEYFTSVREIEERIVRAEKQAEQTKPDFAVPAGTPSDLQEHCRLMADLMVLAFRTDTTRVATFMLANEGSNRSYPMIGVSEGHHSLSHHQNKEEKMAEIRKIDLFLAQQFAYFVEKLKATPEGSGSLLDNAMVMYGSGLSDGNRHNHDDLPVVIAGKAGGLIATGRHLKLDKEVPMNNLFLSMLDRVGAKIDSIGDSTGRLRELEG